jgi:hypothetical protein
MLTRQEQIELVRELTTSIADDVIGNINRGHVPEDWDGIELRQLLADKFRQSVCQMRGSRKREYENTVLVNPNL